MLIKENIIYSIKIQKTNVLGVTFLFYAAWNLRAKSVFHQSMSAGLV